jgi:hypothetical protein
MVDSAYVAAEAERGVGCENFMTFVLVPTAADGAEEEGAIAAAAVAAEGTPVGVGLPGGRSLPLLDFIVLLLSPLL